MVVWDFFPSTVVSSWPNPNQPPHQNHPGDIARWLKQPMPMPSPHCQGVAHDLRGVKLLQSAEVGWRRPPNTWRVISYSGHGWWVSGWLVGWLVGFWLVWLVGWLVGWWVSGWLVGWCRARFLFRKLSII